MARGPDAGTLVERALAYSAMMAGVTMDVIDGEATRWASATFTGARHVLDLRLVEGTAARAWLDALREADLPMHGHLLADCTVVRTRRRDGSIDARLEALTVETA